MVNFWCALEFCDSSQKILGYSRIIFHLVIFGNISSLWAMLPFEFFFVNMYFNIFGEWTPIVQSDFVSDSVSKLYYIALKFLILHIQNVALCYSYAHGLNGHEVWLVVALCAGSGSVKANLSFDAPSSNRVSSWQASVTCWLFSYLNNAP